MGWVRSANRLANKPYRQSACFVQNANQFLETEKRQFLDFQGENLTKLALTLAPRTGFEPAAFRLGGGRSILLSYRGFRLGVAVTRCSSVAVKPGKPLILLDFTVVTLLVMYGFFLLIFIVFCGRN